MRTYSNMEMNPIEDFPSLGEANAKKAAAARCRQDEQALKAKDRQAKDQATAAIKRDAEHNVFAKRKADLKRLIYQLEIARSNDPDAQYQNMMSLFSLDANQTTDKLQIYRDQLRDVEEMMKTPEQKKLDKKAAKRAAEESDD